MIKYEIFEVLSFLNAVYNLRDKSAVEITVRSYIDMREFSLNPGELRDELFKFNDILCLVKFTRNGVLVFCEECAANQLYFQLVDGIPDLCYTPPSEIFLKKINRTRIIENVLPS